MLSSTDIQPTVVDSRSLSAAALVAGAPASAATTPLSHYAAAATALSRKAAATTSLSWEPATAVAPSWEGTVTATLSCVAAATTAPNSDIPLPIALGASSPSPKIKALSWEAAVAVALSGGSAATAAPISDSPSVPEAGLHHLPRSWQLQHQQPGCRNAQLNLPC